jgi:hypothetical protein
VSGLKDHKTAKDYIDTLKQDLKTSLSFFQSLSRSLSPPLTPVSHCAVKRPRTDSEISATAVDRLIEDVSIKVLHQHQQQTVLKPHNLSPGMLLIRLN